ncbi:signal peptidase I [Thermococcus argininiproducens]|uniref:Signal peptidase I n=1 Tax=Thermococcus argininiproducens TaxID=2866384 RepID=A0A9E7SCZ8_9EURY|nr:signal peptidase I [Thermococcus argininiproducens]USG99996.1 signal peptidase I [Thermococcus argininiproducens]
MRQFLETLLGYILFFALILFVLLHLLGFKSVIVLTDSMEPMIKPFSLVIVSPRNDIKIGDVILYEVELSKKKYKVLHRVVDIKEMGKGVIYITKGDNREHADAWYVNKENIIGKLFISLPYVGYASYYGVHLLGLIYPLVSTYLFYRVLLRILTESEA